MASATDDMVVIYRRRRWVELALLLIALALGLGGWAVVHLNVDGALPATWPVVVAISLVLALGAHAVVRWRLPYADPVLLPCTVLLNGLGLTMIDRIHLSGIKAASSATSQMMWTALGVVAFVVLLVVLRDHRPLQRWTYLVTLVGLLLLFLPLVPGIGREINGAQLWVRVGPIQVQPAEIAKLFLAVGFAAYLVERREVLAEAGARVLGIDLPRPRDFAPILLVWLMSLGVLVLQSDLGTSLLFFGLFVMMLYVATERPSWPILGGLLFVVGAVLAWRLFGHVQVRVNGWLDPFDNFERNFQVIQGQFGMAWGGLLGTGLGLGRPQLTPLAQSDFISAAIGEELGAAGLMGLVMVYGLIVFRGLRTALAAREPFGKLLAAGLSFVFVIQVFAIIGGVTRLLPLTGLTTPFMSAGGSALISNWILIGLLMVISHQTRKPLATTRVDTQPDDPATEVIAAVRDEPTPTGGAR